MHAQVLHASMLSRMCLRASCVRACERECVQDWCGTVALVGVAIAKDAHDSAVECLHVRACAHLQHARVSRLLCMSESHHIRARTHAHYSLPHHALAAVLFTSLSAHACNSVRVCAGRRA